MTPHTQTNEDAFSAGRPRRPAADDLHGLLALSARSDRAAYELLHRAVAGPIHGVALQTVRNPARAGKSLRTSGWRRGAAPQPTGPNDGRS
ncbi:hypothetical protein ACFQ0M_47430 [Kitasatospora aburaviensis]